MKKIFTLLAMLCFITNFAFAQLPDGSTAPNFTATDINGNTHNLYDLLESGKSVILDISATWCPPCWTYHNGGELETVWENYGPDGTNEMYVFLIEGDASTGLADLQGTTSATAGNWIAGTEYPIIDNASIASNYQITYFPTVYHICPDKLVTEIGQVSAADHYAAHGACPQITFGSNNVAAAAYTGTSTVNCGTDSQITPALKIRNMGETNLTSCTIEFLKDNNSTQTINWTGDLAPLDEEDVTFDDVTVCNHSEFSFVVTLPNGESDDAAGNNTYSNGVGVNTYSASETYFNITTDFWPDEITWQLKDEDGMTLGSDVDEGALSCDQTYVQSYTLTEGECYTFSIQDGYGDGILNGSIMNGSHNCTTPNGLSNTAMGSVALWSDQGIMWDNISYGEGTDIKFIIGMPAANNEVDLNGLNIFPNPATNQVNLTFDLATASKLEINVYNMLGQQVTTLGAQNYNAGDNNLTINTSSLSNGMYFISIKDGARLTSRKITITK